MEDRIKDGDIPGLTASGGSTAEERKILQALKVCWCKFYCAGGFGRHAVAEQDRFHVSKPQLRVMMHDALCQTADEIFENQRDMVDTKVRYESDDDEDDTQKEAGTSVSTEPTTDGIGGGKQKAPSIDKDKQHATNTLAMDGFAIGDSASSIRYLSDWGSTPNDVDGYSSGAYDEMDDEELRDFDDSYFERRRHDEHDDEWSNESEPEEFQDEDEQDTFMEVSLGSQAIEGSAPNSMSVIEETFDDGVGSGEEDMEEVM
jgi:hypothetical protein